jgi:flavin-dependent dehydrogenase
LKPNGTLNVDVLVLGGGPAGAATALGLRRKGLSVVLVDRSDYTNDRVGETLPPGIRTLLKELGLWEKFTAAGHVASGGVCSSWGREELYENDFILNPHGVGWHVDRVKFDAMVAKEAERVGAVVLLQSVIRGGIEESPRGWKCDVVTRGKARKVRMRFVVDATGRRSGFARRQGVNRIASDRLIGVVGFLSSCSNEVAHDGFTLVESVENGWWYCAALPKGRAVAAYMTDADLFVREAGRGASFWLKQLELTTHTQARLSGFRLASPPLVRCANSARLS